MNLPVVEVAGYQRIKSIDAAQVLGIDTSDPQWGAVLGPRMRALNFEGPLTLGFGGRGNVHRGYQRPIPISAEVFLQQHSEAEGAIGEIARAGLAREDVRELFAVAVAALAEKEQAPRLGA